MSYKNRTPRASARGSFCATTSLKSMGRFEPPAEAGGVGLHIARAAGLRPKGFCVSGLYKIEFTSCL
jgi:hypothetical protein